MNLHVDGFFHIYNRGNNKGTIFFNRENYLYFLTKVKIHITKHAKILAWCLMPNHFHLLVYIPENVEVSKLSNEIKIMLRSYSRAINKQESRNGSLFTQNTRSRTIESNEYLFSCFNYIHQNPMKASLVTKMEDWEFSSFRDHLGLRNGKLVAKEETMKYVEMPNFPEQFYTQSYLVISEEVLSKIL